MRDGEEQGVAPSPNEPSGAGTQVRSELVYRRLVAGGMVYDGKTRRVHHLNEAAALVWEALDQGESQEEAASRLCARFDVDGGRAATDVAAILSAFRGEDLLVEYGA